MGQQDAFYQTHSIRQFQLVSSYLSQLLFARTHGRCKKNELKHFPGYNNPTNQTNKTQQQRRQKPSQFLPFPTFVSLKRKLNSSLGILSFSIFPIRIHCSLPPPYTHARARNINQLLSHHYKSVINQHKIRGHPRIGGHPRVCAKFQSWVLSREGEARYAERVADRHDDAVEAENE